MIEGYHWNEVRRAHQCDTHFLNKYRDALPGYVLEHIGFGDFAWQGPDGDRIDVTRGAPKFRGQCGRSHWLSDNRDGALIEALLAATSDVA